MSNIEIEEAIKIALKKVHLPSYSWPPKSQEMVS